jgi:transcriptional regulator with XRE-family HTH domain
MSEQQPQTGEVRSPPHEVPLEALGQVLRQARESLGIGVREMAVRLRCSPSLVSQVERGVTTPSVHTLFSMVKELGLSLDDLLAAASPHSSPHQPLEFGPWPGRIVRLADRHSIALPGGVKWEMLNPALEDGFEFVEYVYEVGGHDGDDFFRRNGWEYGFVAEGRLGGAIGFARFELETGDSIAFDSSAPHRFWNAGDVPAQAFWVWHNPTGVVETGSHHRLVPPTTTGPS